MNANYQLSIELPGKLEAYLVRRVSYAKFDRSKVETRAQVASYKLIEPAKLDHNTRWRLAEARGSLQVVRALNDYYKSLIIDRLSARLLATIAKACKIDPLFRFKLERPLKNRSEYALKVKGEDNDDDDERK